MRFSCMLLLLTLGTATHAAEGEELAGLWIESQALFYEFRDLESLSHQERIRILQQAEACIQKVDDRQAFRHCESLEQSERKQLRTELSTKRYQLREQRDALLDRL